MIGKGRDFLTLKNLLADRASPGLRRKLMTLRGTMLRAGIGYREIMSLGGKLPAFIIIGTQKGGTTYLYDELTRHPKIAGALDKEPHFFDRNFKRGINWYQAFFPFYTQEEAAIQQGYLTGEASPSYMFHPHAARRLHETLPHARLIMMLRNPVNRAYSHFNHEVRLGYETLSFREAIRQEPERLAGEKEKMLADEEYEGYRYMHFSYLARGIYVNQIQAWLAYFSPEQILIIKSEDFFKHPSKVIQRAVDFLGLPEWEPSERGKPKAFSYPPMDGAIRQTLTEYFRPHNIRLYEETGINFAWNE